MISGKDKISIASNAAAVTLLMRLRTLFNLHAVDSGWVRECVRATVGE